jgi:cytidylate kinase
MSVVTIQGPLGSGAPEVGRLVGDRLKADYVDREIIAKVAARLHRREQQVTAKEMPPSSLLGRAAETIGYNSIGDPIMEGVYLPMEQMPLGDTRYLQVLEYVVKELARSPSLVILGRCSQFILKGYAHVYHVLVVAPMEVRVKRVMQDLKLDQEAAKIEIMRHDSGLREVIKKYFESEIEDPVHYDLVINTKGFSFQAAASIVVYTLSLSEQTTNK